MPEKYKPTPEELGIKQNLAEAEKALDDSKSKSEQEFQETKDKKPRGYWKNISKEELIKEIESRGLDPKNLASSVELNESHADVVRALRDTYGSLAQARIDLGGEPLQKPAGYWKDMSEEDLIKEIEIHGLDAQNLPSYDVLKKDHSSLLHTLAERYGSLNLAKKALGGEVLNKTPGYWEKLSEEDLIKEIKSRGLDPQNLPSTDEISKNHSDLLRGLRIRYKTIARAREKLGGEAGYYGPKYWEEFTLDDLRERAIEEGLDVKNLPGSSYLFKNHPSLFSELKRRYGGMGEIREKLGGSVIKRPAGYWKNLSEEALINEIQLLGLDHSNLPPMSVLNERSPALASGLLARYGTIAKARQALGGAEHYVSPQSDAQREIDNLKNNLEEISEGLTDEAKDIRKLVDIFGNESYIDILYLYHPQYKQLPIGKVKSILADYLGEFLVSNLPPFSLDNIPDKGLELLKEQNFRDSLIEIIKNDALKFFNDAKTKDVSVDPEQIITDYLQNLDNSIKHHNNIYLESTLKKVETYYESLFRELHKPENIVEQVKPNRAFPEFYQEINIKEISDKKKVLLADEMGVGKSASAILAKEYLGVKQALIVAPSNVIDTWRGYLSDEVADDGNQIGYFKPGKAPKILIVDNLKSLNDNLATYDYVLISQERMNQKYAEKLNTLDYGMLIVDEVHKLKNIRSGVRASHLLDLAKSVNGDEKYLALLSGTPIPNKVEDIAITLKLLYPEEFEQLSNKTLVKRIIHSDTIDLRSKLLPRMQMKRLVENVEMPELKEQIVDLELSEEEKEIYELLLEEGEIESSEKMRILRQFLLNPELLDATPNIESTKIMSVGESLNNTFQEKDKVVMFVNGYITNVIRGDKNIINQLNLPPEVEIKIIHGDTSKNERIQIQKELKESGKKVLLLVSGQTADVGVDFSGGESVYFYNEPWTKYEQKQELFRVYRPGLSGELESKSFITKDTIEEGIHLYTQAKEQATEKLLRGLPRSEIENRLLDESERQTDPNLEVNPELARYYFSDWDKMGKIFAYIKEIGQPNFMKFLADFGKDYASCYLNLGSRSYQANADRVSGAIIDRLVKENNQDANELRILDVASGPEMLKQHILGPYQDKVISIDVNEEHFRGEGDKRAVGSFLKLPFAEQSMDYANFALALHYTQLIPSRNNYERLEALLELNRVLKVGGKAVINMIYSVDFQDENKFQNVLKDIGFDISEEYSGIVSKDRNYKSKVFTLEKVQHHSESTKDAVKAIGRDNLEGLKFIDNKSSLKDSRKIIDEFELNGKPLKIELNQEDKEVLKEEQDILGAGEELKAKFGGIAEINKEDVIANGFTRILIKDKYILFKKLKLGRGVVVIK